MKKATAFIGTILMGILLAGCMKSDQQKIVGAWMAEDGTRMEFFEDGTATFQDTKKSGLEGTQSAGTWTKLSDGRFKLTLSAMGMSTVTTFDASFPDKSTMVMNFEGQGTVEMKKQ